MLMLFGSGSEMLSRKSDGQLMGTGEEITGKTMSALEERYKVFICLAFVGKVGQLPHPQLQQAR